MALLPILVLLTGYFTFSSAEMMRFKYDGTKYKVWSEEGSPTKISFRLPEGKIVAKIKPDATLRRLRAGSEVYVVRYDKNGKVREVVQKRGSDRFLAAPESFGGADGSVLTEYGLHRKLIACSTCEETWEDLCLVTVGVVGAVGAAMATLAAGPVGLAAISALSLGIQSKCDTGAQVVCADNYECECEDDPCCNSKVRSWI